MFVIATGLERNVLTRRPMLCASLVLVWALVLLALFRDTDGSMLVYADLPKRGIVQWQGLTYFFLHASIDHLVGNALVFVLIVGPILEITWGRVGLLSLLLLGSFAGSLVHNLIGDPNVPMVGASGGIAACVGALLARAPTRRIVFRGWLLKFWRWHVPVWMWAITGFVLDVLLALMSIALGSKGGGVAAGAHIGGFLFGLGAALVIVWLGLEERVLPSQRADTMRKKLGFAKGIYDAIDNQEFARARMVLQAAVRKNPNNTDAVVLAAKVEVASHAPDAAHTVLDALRKVGQSEDGLAVARAFEELAPDKPLLQMLDGATLFRLGRSLLPNSETHALGRELLLMSVAFEAPLRRAALESLLDDTAMLLQHRYRWTRRLVGEVLQATPTSLFKSTRRALEVESSVLDDFEALLDTDPQAVQLVPAAVEVMAHRREQPRIQSLLRRALRHQPTGAQRAEVVKLLRRYDR